MISLDPLTVAGAAAVVLGVGVPIGIAVGRRISEPATLCCIAGPLRGRTIDVVRAVRIGRGPDCDLRTVDAATSRLHAEVAPTADGLHLRDLGSGDGVWSDGRRIFETILQPGGQFQVGTNVFALLMRAQPWPAPREHRLLAGGDVPIHTREFAIESLMHTGARFTTMRARDDHGALVAVKYLHDRRDAVRARLVVHLDAAKMRTAMHPALVGVRGGNAAAPQPYLIEELVDGASLRTRRGAAMSRAEARDALARLCDVVEDLHGFGVCHGALDDGDVLFAADGSIRLLGVGTASVFDAVPNHPEDDVAALADLGNALLGMPARCARARSVAELRRRWGVERHTAQKLQPTDVFRPLRLRVRDTAAVVSVTSNPFVLGRALNPADRRLSRRHAELSFVNNMWIVRTRRGAPVIRNGVVLAADASVAIGDELTLGETALVISE